jgi:pullulanase
MVAEILQSQIAVSALTPDGAAADATGLQIPGVLDDLYTYNGELGVTWEDGVPTIRLWAPTAKSVTFHLFANPDPATTSTTQPMSSTRRQACGASLAKPTGWASSTCSR